MRRVDSVVHPPTEAGGIRSVAKWGAGCAEVTCNSASTVAVDDLPIRELPQDNAHIGAKNRFEFVAHLCPRRTGHPSKGCGLNCARDAHPDRNCRWPTGINAAPDDQGGD